jgi:chromate transport protein ChrA
MTKEELWHGIPLPQIPWYPTVDADACIACSLCFVTSGSGVYEMQDRVAVGLRLRGVAGAAASFVGFGLPAFLLMTTLSTLYGRTSHLPAEHRLFELAVLMFRIDVFALGGGFASVSLMFHEILEVRSWIDGPTFVNGIALGQMTPGPIVITDTFVGVARAGARKGPSEQQPRSS